MSVISRDSYYSTLSALAGNVSHQPFHQTAKLGNLMKSITRLRLDRVCPAFSGCIMSIQRPKSEDSHPKLTFAYRGSYLQLLSVTSQSVAFCLFILGFVVQRVTLISSAPIWAAWSACFSSSATCPCSSDWCGISTLASATHTSRSNT